MWQSGWWQNHRPPGKPQGYISATALCAFAETGFSILLSDFALRLLPFANTRSRPWSAQPKVLGLPPSLGPLSIIIALTTSPCKYSLCCLLDPIYNSWTSDLVFYLWRLFTCLLFCKSIMLNVSFKRLTKRKSNTIEKRQGLPSTLMDMGLKLDFSNPCIRHHRFIGI